MNSKLEEKLQKLLALAEGGVGGEKENARELLDILLKKHGLTMDDINQEEKYLFMFEYKGELQKRLLGQVIHQALELGMEDTDQLRQIGETSLGARMTKGQMVEVDFIFRVYREAMKEELDLFFMGFVSRQGLASVGGGSNGKVWSKWNLEKIRLIARLIEPVMIRKEIVDEME